MKENYERWMNREIQRFQARGEVPRLLLHSCCAPCSSAVLESVFRYFKITVFYYNPNIFPKEEYLHRVQEQKRFLAQFPPASSAGTVLSACTGTGTGTGRRRKMRPLLRAAAAPHRRAGQRARFFVFYHNAVYQPL